MFSTPHGEEQSALPYLNRNEFLLSLVFTPELTTYFSDNAEDPVGAALALETLVSFYAKLHLQGLTPMGFYVDIEGEYAVAEIPLLDEEGTVVTTLNPRFYLKPFAREITLIEDFLHSSYTELRKISSDYEESKQYESENFSIFLVVILAYNALAANELWSQDYPDFDKFTQVAHQWMTVKNKKEAKHLMSHIKREILGLKEGNNVQAKVEQAVGSMQDRDNMILAFAKSSLANQNDWHFDNPILEGVYYSLEESPDDSDYMIVNVASSFFANQPVCQLPVTVLATQGTIENYLTTRAWQLLRQLSNTLYGLTSRGLHKKEDIIAIATQQGKFLNGFLCVGQYTTLNDGTLDLLYTLHTKYTSAQALLTQTVSEMADNMIEMSKRLREIAPPDTIDDTYGLFKHLEEEVITS